MIIPFEAASLYIHRISTGKCSVKRVDKRAKRVTTSSDHTFVDWVFFRDKEDDEIMTHIGIIRWFSYHLTWHVEVDVRHESVPWLSVWIKRSKLVNLCWDNDLLLSVTRHPGFNFFQRNRVMHHEKIRNQWMMLCCSIISSSFLSIIIFVQLYLCRSSLSSLFFSSLFFQLVKPNHFTVYLSVYINGCHFHVILIQVLWFFD